MPLVATAEIIDAARARGSGVGAFNIVQLEHAEAIATGAEHAALPVILQISENTAHYHGALRPIARAAAAIAEQARVPVALHLDHAESDALAREALDLGFGSVMFDASTRPYAENVLATAQIVEHCHARGVWVEAELGRIGGKDGAHAPGVRTDPGEAGRFVADTGVDALAVAVGSSHAMLTRTAALDFDLIARLREHLAVPLVLHGSSGVSDADLAEAVRAGMTKVNIATHLNRTLTDVVKAYLQTHASVADTRKYLGPARDAVSAEVCRLLHVLDGAADRAADRAAAR